MIVCKILIRIQTHTTIVITPDGSLIATGDATLARRVKLWNAATGELDRDLGSQHDNVSTFSFSRDGTRMLSGSVSHQTASIWDLGSKKLVRTHWTRLPVPSGFRWVALSPDGAMMASVHGDNVVRLWDAATGAQKLAGTGHTGHVMGLAFHPKENLLATGDQRAAWWLWDVAARKELHCCSDLNTAASALAFSPDGRMLAGAGHLSSFGVWNVDSKALVSKGGWGSNFALTFVPGAGGAAPGLLAIGNSNKHSVDFYDPLTGKEMKRLQLGIAGGVGAIACSPDGRLLAACNGRSSKAVVHVRDLASETPVFLIKHDAGGVSSIAFAPDSKILATAGEGSRGRTNHVYLWSMTDGAELARLAPVVHAQDPPLYGPRREIAFSPDGKLLAVTGRDGVVRLFDVRTRREVGRLDGQQGGVWRVAFSPDSSLLATAGCDTTVLLWPMKMEQP